MPEKGKARPSPHFEDVNLWVSVHQYEYLIQQDDEEIEHILLDCDSSVEQPFPEAG